MKIIGLIGLSILFMCLIGFSGFYYLNKINANAKEMYRHNMMPNELLNQIIINNAQIDGLQLELMISENYSAARQKEINDEIGTIIDSSIAAQKELEAIGMTDEIRQLYDAFKNSIGASNEARDAMLANLTANRIAEAYTVYINELKPVRSGIMNTLVSIKKINEESAAQLNETNKNDAAASQRNLILLLLASLIVCGAVSVWLSRMITSPLGKLKILMQKAQNGDLSVRGSYDSKDEIGVLTAGFNDMIASLRAIVFKIGQHSEMLSVSSEELLASSAQTSEASSHIAAEIQEVADGMSVQFNSSRECTRAMDEVAAGIQRVAESAADVSGIARYTTDQALHGSEKIRHVSGQLDSILHTSQASAAVIKKLDLHSQEIGSIVDIIKGISGQINLLALNASIEAARAGEHGRGFAVVAQEVRKLAEQSNQSSEQISAIITEIQSSTSEAVEMMEKESSEISQGLQGMLEAKRSFEQIVGSIQEVNQQLEEVSAASEQISASSQEVSASLQVTEEIAGSSSGKTQSVAAASEEQMATMKEVEEAVKSLTAMAEELQELSSRFVI
ncbi:HAMP domain-containing methyl-accepting chemotaxis protein [Paenibacillus sp. PK3_47]|uniref:methyl-accepting chemotaxis protein n=1 Tax=Paenibacillus sp. PK3_47 TaxID=2072642 RepID=UPI00201DA57C|nr:HAMP domain-containing methyl-accepting chemotaxis protein [Paenibacillus sp. PK3_47]